jgi:predicted nucleic acid-binding protein
MIKVALDTNILVYNHDTADLRKQEIARELLALPSNVSAQTVSEYINVLKRMMAKPKIDILRHCLQGLKHCTILPVEKSTLGIAKHIVLNYDLQIFDSIIVASAQEASCNILYSEDMQHNQDVMGVRIINPFL